MCYISGGLAPGRAGGNANPGSRDKTPPIEDSPVVLDRELYFAGNNTAWGGATAFIRIGNSSTTLGRMYLITDEQFNDVTAQENNVGVNGDRFVPAFDKLATIGENGHELSYGLYRKLLRIGAKDGHPMLTFTKSRDLPISAPSKPYIQAIFNGLVETYPDKTDAELCEYLSLADGIKGSGGVDLRLLAR